ncbi:unnamed protein product [Callosobruchus maculatus]|uniref:Uncharacterized protein n=1 Tax=Callosobruchus maculatus TaxID=64391 RepID=A0A653BKZ9_CALMS|nr:unnamed protein product [Callosobruchus maculatus]
MFDITMASKILLLFVGVFLLCGAAKESEAAIPTDLFLTGSDEVSDDLPSDAKFDIAKLVRELLEKLRGILDKLLAFAEKQFSKALEKGNGVIRKVEEQTKLKIEAIRETVNKQIHEIIDKAAENGTDVSHCVRIIEEKFQTVLEQLLQELNAEIDNALTEETAKMRDSLDKSNPVQEVH